MTPTQQEIADAARVVGGRLKYINFAGATVHFKGTSPRIWQPWADTEAGRSDALVLLAAVSKRIKELADARKIMLGSPLEVAWDALDDAIDSGNVQHIQQATFAAASAIGKHLRESE